MRDGVATLPPHRGNVRRSGLFLPAARRLTLAGIVQLALAQAEAGRIEDLLADV